MIAGLKNKISTKMYTTMLSGSLSSWSNLCMNFLICFIQYYSIQRFTNYYKVVRVYIQNFAKYCLEIDK